jgi:hypothetical protein
LLANEECVHLGCLLREGRGKQRADEVGL